MRYALVWSAEGRERKAVIEPGEHFLGRMPSEDAEALGVAADPFTVYLYSTESGEVIDTEVASLVVGRRHAKLVARAGGVGVHPTLDVIDYGLRGTGSKNGTYVNGERIRPGERVRLQVGDRVRLASIGPTFIVAHHTGGETVIRTVVGVPEELPRETADKLERMGLIAERRDADDVSVVIIREGAEVGLGGGVTVVSEDLGSERARRLRLFWFVGRAAHLAIEALMEGKFSEAVAEVRKLDLQAVRDFINGLGDDALSSVYTDLMAVVRLGGEGVERDALVGMLRRLREYLDAYVAIL